MARLLKVAVVAMTPGAAVMLQQNPDKIADVVDTFRKNGGKDEDAKAYWVHNVKKISDRKQKTRKEQLEQKQSLEERIRALGVRVARMETERKETDASGSDASEYRKEISALRKQREELARQNSQLNEQMRKADAVANTGRHEDQKRAEEEKWAHRKQELADEQAAWEINQAVHQRKDAEKKAALDAEKAARREKEMAERAAEQEELRKRQEHKSVEEEIEQGRREAARAQQHLAKELENEEHRRKLAEKETRQLEEKLQEIERLKNEEAKAQVMETETPVAQVERPSQPAGDEIAMAAQPDSPLTGAFFKDLMGDVSMSSMHELVKALKVVVKDRTFLANFTAASTIMKDSRVEYSDRVHEHVLNFAREVGQSSEKEFVPLLAKFLAETENIVLTHQRHTVGVAKMLKEAMPVGLRVQLFPIALKMVPKMSPFTKNTTYFTDLAKASAAEVCGQVAGLMEGIGHTSNLTYTKDMIDATSKALPMLSAINSDINTDVTDLLQNLVSLGYSEVVALEKTSHGIAETVGPMIRDKLHCTWKAGAAARPSLLAAALLALAAATRFL